MTDHVAFSPEVVAHEPTGAPAARRFSTPFFFATTGVCLALAFALGFTRAQAVWTTGAFFDSDDAMRAVQLRDYLAGQGWFDLAAHRLDPPNGASMHWSRVVDVALAAFERVFSFLTPEYAERATRLAFPFALLVALFALVARLTNILAGPAARPAAVWLTLLSGAVFVQFAPGRFDHHAPQIVALVAALSLLLQGLEPARAWRIATAAALMALSVAISLENLPFILVMIASLPLIFIIDGEGAPLLWFSAGALIAFPALYVATVAPAAFYASYCDAYSFVHLGAIATGALSFAALGALAPRLITARARFIGVIAAGAATAATVAMIAPRCVGDPLNSLDPWLRDLWLSHVAESRPLLSFWAEAPGVVIAIATPVLLGLIASFACASRAEPVARRRWLVLAATIFAGLVAGLWQTRVFTSVTPIAMAPLAVAVVSIAARLPVSAALRIALAATLALAVSPLGLALAIPSANEGEGSERACLAPENFKTLATMAPARVAAPFDLGAHLLAHTPHSAYAAPYHRNNHGNLIVARAFTAPPEQAEKILREAGAELVVWC
ncbi:MAG: hypothetical protein N2444_03970, partial [Methylocystis sp.]|nr:hypothetical protein [Methylocystis sp.]